LIAILEGPGASPRPGPFYCANARLHRRPARSGRRPARRRPGLSAPL